jgi:hypothetical protein
MDLFLAYVKSAEKTAELYDQLTHLMDHVDGPAVREQLRKWWRLRVTADDLEVTADRLLSETAFSDLVDRGDDSVIEEHLAREVDHHQEHGLHAWAVDDLALFDRDKVRYTLRTMLQREENEKKTVVILDLIGHLGNDVDLPIFEKLSKSDIDEIANAAFDAQLRLRDPLRLPEHW